MAIPHTAIDLGRRLAVLSICAGVLFGCERSPEEREVLEAYGALTQAIIAGDVVQLFDQSHPSFADEVAAFQRRLKQGQAELYAAYPASEALRLSVELGLEKLDPQADPRTFFVSAAGLEGLRVGSAVADGLSPGRIVIADTNAEVHSVGGEIFEFRRDDDGAWRSRLASSAFRDWETRRKIEENLDRLAQQRARIEAVRKHSDDVRTPEGAVNRFRQAALDGKHRIIYSLLDEATRQSLDGLMDRRHAPTEAARPMFEASADAAALALKLLGQPDVARSLPLDATDFVRKVETSSKTHGAVYTTSDKVIPVRLEGGTTWRLAGLQDAAAKLVEVEKNAAAR